MNKFQAYKSEKTPAVDVNFAVGDTVDVHCRIVEGDKERIQIFTGTVLAMKNLKNQGTFTVRHLFQGQGVEKVFPFGSPAVEKVDVKRRGRTRRAKLYYLRDREGKATRVREKI